MTGQHLLIKALLVYYEHKGKYTYSNHVTVVTDLVLKYEWKVKIFQTIPDCYLINVRFCWLFSVCLPFQLITTLISFPVSGLLSGKNIHLASVFFLQYRGRLHRVSWFLKDRDLKVSNNRIFLSLFVWRRLTDCPNYQYMSNINCYFIDLVAKNFLKLSCYRNQSSWFSPQYCSDLGVGGWSVLWYLLWYDLLWEHWTSLTATPTLQLQGNSSSSISRKKEHQDFSLFRLECKRLVVRISVKVHFIFFFLLRWLP